MQTSEAKAQELSTVRMQRGEKIILTQNIAIRIKSNTLLVLRTLMLDCPNFLVIFFFF